MASLSWWFGRSVGPMGMVDTWRWLESDDDEDDVALDLFVILGMLFADCVPRCCAAHVEQPSWEPLPPSWPHSPSPLKRFPACTKSSAAL